MQVLINIPDALLKRLGALSENMTYEELVEFCLTTALRDFDSSDELFDKHYAKHKQGPKPKYNVIGRKRVVFRIINNFKFNKSYTGTVKDMLHALRLDSAYSLDEIELLLLQSEVAVELNKLGIEFELKPVIDSTLSAFIIKGNKNDFE